MEESEKIDSHRKQRYQTLSSVILSFIKILVWILGVLWVLGELDIDYAPFLVAAGGISLAIGFGAQSLVKDMVSGFFILMEEQFALGDFVEIGGESGTVEKISLRTIKFRSLDGTLHTVPNGSISTVSNKTYQWSRAVVKVGVSYDDDTQKVLSVLKTVCQQIAVDPEWKESLIDDPTAQGILSFGDSSINFRVLAKTPPGMQWAVEREFHIRIKKAFDREGIEIPYNIVNVLERKETK
jgi:small conductance mechanosensitive channel